MLFHAKIISKEKALNLQNMKSIFVTVWVIHRVCSKIAMATNNNWSVSSDRLISSHLSLTSELDTEIYTGIILRRSEDVFYFSWISDISKILTKHLRKKNEYSQTVLANCLHCVRVRGCSWIKSYLPQGGGLHREKFLF